MQQRCRVKVVYFFFQAEDGIRYLVRSRGLGDVYKRQGRDRPERLAKLLRVSAQAGRRNHSPAKDCRSLQNLSLIHI